MSGFWVQSVHLSLACVFEETFISTIFTWVLLSYSCSSVAKEEKALVLGGRNPCWLRLGDQILEIQEQRKTEIHRLSDILKSGLLIFLDKYFLRVHLKEISSAYPYTSWNFLNCFIYFWSFHLKIYMKLDVPNPGTITSRYKSKFIYFFNFIFF